MLSADIKHRKEALFGALTGRLLESLHQKQSGDDPFFGQENELQQR